MILLISIIIVSCCKDSKPYIGNCSSEISNNREENRHIIHNLIERNQPISPYGNNKNDTLFIIVLIMDDTDRHIHDNKILDRFHIENNEK